MNDQIKKKEGIDIDKIKIDQNGEVEGLDDDLLDTISAGLRGNEGCNYNCEPPVGG